jgi:hypothetical protein
LESGYEKDPRDQGALPGAPHEQELQDRQGPKETQDRRGFQVLQRTQEAQDLRDRVETQGQKARRDRLDHVETPETRGLQESKVALDSKGRLD